MCRVLPGTFVYPPGGMAVVMAELLSPEALRAAVAGLGYELVDVRVSGPTSRRLVRIRIDVSGGGAPGAGVTTDDCRQVSRALEASLESAGAVGERYTLEVSSPGMEQPVRFVEHWRRFVGRQVRLEARGVSGSRVATIAGVPDEKHVELRFDDGDLRLPLEAVKSATLVVDWSALG